MKKQLLFKAKYPYDLTIRFHNKKSFTTITYNTHNGSIDFVINEDVPFDDIQRVIKSGVQQNVYRGCEVFDVYQGDNIEKGYKSIAVRIKMLDENATLTDDVIERNMQSVREKLQKAYADISFRE